jgi:hypothetical protein
MRTLALVRVALCMSVATALLAACGGSQPPIGAPGAMPQSHAVAAHADRSRSWMLPEAQSEDLLYVSGAAGRERAVKIFSYPRGKLVGELTGFGLAAGLCTDSAGDVFVMDAGDAKIVEYPHGGTSPVATLDAPELLTGCSVDPSTGNLAATGAYLAIGNALIAVYPWSGSGFGAPSTYTDSRAKEFGWCTYDNSGDLFANGTTETGDSGLSVLDELPQGHTSLVNISVDQSLAGDGAVQWNGTYLAMANPVPYKPLRIYQVEVTGSTGTVVNSTTLRTAERWAAALIEFWIQGGKIIAPEDNHDVGIWRYPRGGRPTKSVYALYDKIGVAVSLAPHSSRRHSR